jgi:hypothetical protein
MIEIKIDARNLLPIKKIFSNMKKNIIDFSLAVPFEV